jgi:biotin synthase
MIVTEKEAVELIARLESMSDEAIEIDASEAVVLAESSLDYLPRIMALADRVRRVRHGNQVGLCAIVNAKSGRCSEDCAFCAQSSYYDCRIEEYDLLDSARLLAAAESAAAAGAYRFSLVTSGKSPSATEMDALCATVTEIRTTTGLKVCASLGVLDEVLLLRLKKAGVDRYHHNLETARSHFSQICTTHDYEEDIETVKTARKLGLQICVGGIFGLGESAAQRIELAALLKELDVDAMPVNFLNPIPGTPLENSEPLGPRECLKLLALYRMMLPEKELIICGGREVNLGQFQSGMFFAGASGLMIGNYLTTSGRPTDEDAKLIADLGLEIVK